MVIGGVFLKVTFKMGLLLFLSLFLSGCDSNNVNQYNESIQTGLDYLAAEDYARATIQFEQALEDMPDDDRAGALLNQTVHYEKALKATENSDNEDTLEEAKNVINFTEGSKGLIFKAESLIEELQTDSDK